MKLQGESNWSEQVYTAVRVWTRKYSVRFSARAPHILRGFPWFFSVPLGQGFSKYFWRGALYDI
jgi:hypothetical protein